MHLFYAVEEDRQYVVSLNQQWITAGMGGGGERTRSGDWKPSSNKPNDKRFVGKPGEKRLSITVRVKRLKLKLEKMVEQQ